jgi:AAA15 family ATPase/GTPase
MNKKQLTSLTIKGFKVFEDFHINGMKRVNLIGGKNNLGKTSFLEALEMLLKAKTAFGLRIVSTDIIRRRQTKKSMSFPQQQMPIQDIEFDFFANKKNKVIIQDDKSSIQLRYIDVGEAIESNTIQMFNAPMVQSFAMDVHKRAPTPFLEFWAEGDSLASSVQDVVNTFIQDVNHVEHNVHYISSCTTDETALAGYYGRLMMSNQEDFLNASLQQFDNNMLALKAIPIQGSTVFKLKLKDRDDLILLSSFGEGINRYIAILSAIWASKDGYLLIDEIENGIHYTNYPKLWKLIFEASKLANCQLFITTHSKECIEAFNEQSTQDDGAYFEFYRNQKTGKITAKGRDHEQLEYALTHQGSIRGE